MNIDPIMLDLLSKKLKGVVSPVNILKWLSNFRDSETHLAIVLLRNLKIFTSYEIEEHYQIGLNIILRDIPTGSKIAVHPIGTFGKSGSMMAYLLKKTDSFSKNSGRIELCSNIESVKDLSKEFKTLVLLDDFIGTGKSVETYYKTEIEKYKDHFSNIYFLGVAGMVEALGVIRPYFKKVIIDKNNIYRKAFSSQSSNFGYRKHQDYRDLSYKYGSLLSKPIHLKSGKLKFEHALGYENSQALVAFFYGSPNNTLPIFWQGDTPQLKWTPLVPRFSFHKIAIARAFRKQLSFELSLISEFGSEFLKKAFTTYVVQKGTKKFSSVNHIDFSIYGILKLQREGFNEFSICQRLGISTVDYMTYLQKGKAQGIFDKHFEITERGLELYIQARKCIAATKEEKFENMKSFNVRNNTYFPKSFNGKT
ncbi:phosphoribosyltransferase-like protein [Pedobacter panaciterrae]